VKSHIKPGLKIVAPLTPFLSDETVNFDMIPQLAEILFSRGAEGFYLCGGTGEGLLLTSEERMRLVECWRSILPDDIFFVVQVAAGSPVESIELARHAESVGASGISAVTPSPYAAPNMGALVAHFARIAAAAPSKPFYYYHNSSGPGLKIKAYDFLTAARDHIPNLGGIKFTDENLMDFNRCLKFSSGDYDILYGKDEMALGALALGAKGFIGGSYNILSPLLGEVLIHWEHGRLDAALQAQSMLIDAIAVFGRWGGLGALKAAAAGLGLELGPMRSPLKTVPRQDWPSLFAELDEAWPDWRKKF
jgi:N-acetylneuraminate lyase